MWNVNSQNLSCNTDSFGEDESESVFIEPESSLDVTVSFSAC